MNRALNLLNASRIGTRLIIAGTILTIVAAMVFVSSFAQEDVRLQQPELTVENADVARRKAAETPTEKKEISTVQDESGLAPEAILAVANTANYTFTTNSTSSLMRTAGSGVDNIDMSTGAAQLLANSLDDTASAITPIGFDFFLMGVRYNQFSINDNGNMRLGTTAVGTAQYNIPSGTIPLLNPFGNDMRVGTDGVVISKVIGTAPNRVLVVQWSNIMIRFLSTAAAGGGTFQARLYETTGAIEYVYGSMVTNAASPTTYTVGFSVNTTANNIISVNTTTHTASTSATVTTNSYSASSTVTQLHSTTDGSRREYLFAPPISTAPTSLTFTGVTTTGMTLNWVDSPDEVAYAIYRSTDGVNFSYAGAAASDATSFVATGLAHNQSYTWQVYAVSEGRLSSALSGTQATNAGTVSGTRTVGPTGNYLSLTAAFSDITTNGLGGAVILELQSTYLSTVETFPLVPPTIAGPTSSITVRPTTGATALSISSASTTATFNLNNAAYITIDGRAGGAGASQLTVANTSTSGTAFQFINEARNNTLQFLTITGVNTSATNGVVLFSTTTGANGNSNNLIDNCNIKDGATTPANGVYSSGTATAQNNGNTISNSNISNFFIASTTVTTGVLISATGNNAWTISNNKFFQTATRTYTTTAAIHSAIQIAGGLGNLVSGNTIGFASSAGTGIYTMTGTIATRFIGINVGAQYASIQGNTIAGHSLTSSSGAATTNGIWAGISSTAGGLDIGTVTANTIGSGTGTGSITTSTSSTGGLTVGMNIVTSATANISGNTIGSITANGSTTSISASITGIQMSVGTPNIINNLIGSNSTALSINSPTVSTNATAQALNGINILSTVLLPTNISSNIVANLSGAGTGTAGVGRGITYSGTGLGTISSNTIHDIASASTNTAVAGGGTAVQGILYTGTSTTGATVSLNTIYTLSATNTGAVQTNVTGIGYSNPSNGVVTRNKIYDLRNASTMAVATTPPTASGILIRAALGTSGTFTNNMISLGSSQTTNTEFIGIWNSFLTNTLNIHYNSVHIAGTVTSGALPSFGFLRGDNTATSAITTPVDIKNNILNNTRTGGTGKHYAIGNANTVPATGWGATASNNNVLNSAVTSTVGLWGLALDRDFAQWKTSSGGDNASLSGVSVIFADAPNGDLHLNFGLTPTPIESGGTVVATTVDYDNQNRPGPAGSVNGGAFAPDIGADEFDGVPQDISAPVITYTPFGNTTQTGNRTLSVTITDNIGVSGGANAPRIYYRKNGGSYVSNQCGAPTGNVYPCTIDYSLVSGVTTGDVIDYFVVAQDAAGNVSANPSAGFSATSVNSITTPPTTPNTYTIVGAFPSTVTVGSGGTYASLTNTGGLFEAMNAAVFTGHTTVDIISNLAGETGAVALNKLNEEGAGAGTFTVIIKPSGVARSITGTGVNLIKLNGANRVTIDGSLSGGTDRSLTIENTNATVPNVVWIGSVGTTPVTNDTLKNCIIRNGVNTGTGAAAAVVISDAGTLGVAGFFSTIIVQNNDIQKSAYGVFANGGTTPQNGSNLTYTQNNLNTSGANALRFIGLYMQGVNGATVSNNTVGNFGNTTDEIDVGVWLASGTINSTVSGNTVTTLGYTGTNAFAPIGINVTSGVATTGNDVTGNSVSNISSNGTTAVRGIVVSGTTSDLTIQKNNVQGIINTNTGTYGAYGMDISGGNNIVVKNNFVSNVNHNMSGGLAFDTTFGVVGIRVGAGTGHQIYHNSVNLYGLQPGTSTTQLLTAAFAIVNTTSTGMDVRNNVFANNITGGTTSIAHVSIYLPSGGTSAMNLTLNNNAYYNGTDAARQGLAQAGTTAGTGFYLSSNFNAGATTPSNNFRNYSSTLSVAGMNDNASLASTAAPPFISNNDLHITGSNVLLGAGVAIGSVTTDYDNDPRPASNPDIGADEVVAATGGTIGAGTYYNVNAANGDTLGGDVTVTNQLTLNGILNTGSFTLTLECGASVVGAGASNYVIGNVKKNYCATGSFSYPVGTANGYSPLDANITTLTTNPSSLTVKATQGPQPTLASGNFLQRYWTLTEIGDLTADLTFNYNDPTDIMGTEANYRIIRVVGSTAVSFPNACPTAPCVDFANDQATIAGVSEFSDWTLGEPDAPTAVKLRSFVAKRTEDGVLLEWDSGFEVDNLGYHIYREQQGQRVRVTPSLVAGSALKTGQGAQLTAGMSYAWWDMNASASAQYWLEDIDLDGKQTMYGPFTQQQAQAGAARPTASRLLSQLTDKNGLSSSAAQREWPAVIEAQSAKSVEAISRAQTSSLEQQFGLAGQAAVKLSVNQDGWYRVTRADLVAAGLNANADNARLQLYLNGEEQPIKVGTDGTVEFYGRRLEALTTDKGVYWLIEGTTSGQRIQTLPTLPAGGQMATGFPMTVERRDRMIYFSSLQNGDASNIFGPIVGSQTVNQSLQLRHPDAASSAPAQLEVALQGITTQNHLVSVSVNGQQVGVVSFTGRAHTVWQSPVPMSALVEGENLVTLTRMNGEGDTSLVDYVRVTYARAYEAEANQLACTVQAGSAVKLGGFTTADIRVMDVSDAAQPRELNVTAEPDGQGFAVRFEAAQAAQLVAFTGSSQMQQPAAMVANEPSAWNSLPNGANMVIITHRDFRQAVEPLAAHRRTQGLSVAVIDVEDIYDEFSFSKHGPQAIKDFLDWTRQHWTTSPQYVLLVGDSSWDARNELGLSQSEFVPTRLIDTAFMETASDDWLADFNNDGIAEMAVGRLPVKTAAQAATIVQKIIGYDQLRFDPRRGAMLVADNGFESASQDISNAIPQRMPIQMINRSSASDSVIRQQILNGINAGPRIVNYYGHGSVQVWTGAGLLQNSDAPNLTNGGKLAVFTLMNCLNGYAHDAYIDSLGEALLKAENGGAVAVWASSGYTEPGGQTQINRQLYQQVFTNSAVRLGDAIRSAKGATMNGDVRRTWVLLGDPSMTVK